MNFARFCTANAGKYPTREFLVESFPSRGERRVLTWRQLDERTNRLANFLTTECGITEGDVVQHLLMNSLEWYIAYMAVLKIGAVISPLNFRFASGDIKYACDVTRTRTFILGEQFLPRVLPIRDEIPYCRHFIVLGDNVPEGFNSLGDILAGGDPSPALVDIEDEHTAELMFTSGTTGAPKPVSHSHGTLFWIALGNALTYNEGFNSNYLAPHPFYHSGTMFLSFPSFVAAGKILMPMELAPKQLLQSIVEEKCTGGWLTVPTWSDVISAIKAGEIYIHDYDLSSLRHIELGAQPVPFVLLEDTKKIFPNLPIGNIYGITEGGGGGLTNCYDEDILRKPGSIGRPTAFMEAKIADSELNEMPAGQVGELLLKGPRLMKEYAFNSEMTAQTIVGGWLRTGDLAYMDDEGFIFFTDRAKDLIIRGGENIFPAEVEDVLRKHPAIQDAAVMGYPHPRLVEIVLAVVQLKPGHSLELEEVVGFVKDQGLAKFKWPEKIIFADVPRNPAGKIEKPKLREIYVKPAKEEMERMFRMSSAELDKMTDQGVS